MKLLALVAVLGMFSSTAFAQQTSRFTVSPSADEKLNFYGTLGNQTQQNVTITNTTNAVLPISVDLKADSGGFLTTGLAGTVVLLPHTSAQLGVVFTPTRPGNYEGKLTISDGMTSVQYNLQGITNSNAGGSLNLANQVTFENVMQGTQSCKPISIRNTTTMALNLMVSGMTGDTSQFQVEGNGLVNVLANMDSALTVCYTPTGNQTSADAVLHLSYQSATDSSYHGTADVRLHGNAQVQIHHDSSFTFTGFLNFLGVDVGGQQCQSVNFNNTTNVAITIDSVRFSGDTAGFTTQMAAGSTIGANSTGTITVCYAPTMATNNANATLTLAYHSPNDSTIYGNLYVRIHADAEMEDTTTTGNHNCLLVRHMGGILGPIISGGTVNDSIMVVNRTNSAITITGVTVGTGDSSAFSVTNTFPVTVAANGETMLNLHFAPTDSNQVRYTSNVTLMLGTGGENCNTVSFQIGGVAVPGNNGGGQAGGHINIDSLGNDVVGVHGNVNTTTTTTVTFVNNTANPITVTGVTLADTTNFHVISTTPTLPTVLQPGAQLNVVVGLTGNVPGFVSTDLMLNTSNSITPRNVIVQGILLAPQNDVKVRAAGDVKVLLSPNPSHGAVRVDLTNAAKAKVEVYDILGQIVASGSASDYWSWNGTTAAGIAANGTYIVRITGVDTNGKNFTVSRQVVIQH